MHNRLTIVLLYSTNLIAQTGNHVFTGAEQVSFGVESLSTSTLWSTDRLATPGYFSAVGTATYTNADDTHNVNGYVKHYVRAANQGFVFPVGTGTDLRTLTTSGIIANNSEFATAWILGNPSGNLDPTSPNAGAHNITSLGAGIFSVSVVGQWDWQDLSNNAAGITVTVSIPDMTAYASANDLRLVGWNGTKWINLSGATGASANTENNTLSGIMTSGITAIGIGKYSDPCTDGTIVGTPTANDPDGDGINDVCDLDDDNDGILDTDEGCAGTKPNNVVFILDTSSSVTDASYTEWATSINDLSTELLLRDPQINIAIVQHGALSQAGGNTITSTANAHISRNFSNVHPNWTLADRDNTLGPYDHLPASMVHMRPFWENGGALDLTTGTENIIIIISDADKYSGTSNLFNQWPTDPDALAGFGEYEYLKTTYNAKIIVAMAVDFPIWGENYSAATDISSVVNGVNIANLGDFSFSPAEVSTMADNTVIIDDADGDGIPNCLDLDSDGDGCPDAIEAAVPTVLKTADIVNGDGTTNTITSTANAVIDITKDPVGTNGYGNSLESDDTSGATAVNAFVATNYSTYALDAIKNGCGIPMITQVYWKGAEKIVEVTNNDAAKIVVPFAVNLNTYNAGITTQAVGSVFNTTEITGGNSMLFSGGAVTAQHTGAPIVIPGAGVFDAADDIVIISRKGGTNVNSISWDSRIDVVSGLKNNTSFVRIDETLVPNTTYTAAEWVEFVDDRAIVDGGLDPYSNPPQRHPHDPLQSEITSGVNTEANALLGLHRFGITKRTGTAWSNGYPDRSRHVVIEEDYNHSGSRLSARKLVVNNGSKLAVTDNLLAVTNDITLTVATDELRLVGTSQLVQTHTGATQVSGNGKLLVDQNSTVPSLYRYNYFSSPVNTIGGTTYSIETVLKDGTTPLDASTAIGTIAKDITFVAGYDGDTTDPISLAEYWIYTYAASGGTRAGWEHKYRAGTIPQTDGFIMKGPGRAQNYTFVGTPKDGLLTTAIGVDDDYLVGNPFASALSVKKFIEDNATTIDATLYFWEHHESVNGDGAQNAHNYGGYIGGYATRTISMGTAANSVNIDANNGTFGTSGIGLGSYKSPGAYVPMGQGFFVDADADGGTITFNNSQREFIGEGANSVFFKGNNNTKRDATDSFQLPIIKLGMNYLNEDGLELHRQIGISFASETSFGVDYGYDSKINDLGKTDVYWKFENNDEKYVITGVQEISVDLEVPLEIVMDYDGDVTFTIDEWQLIDRDVYLTDLELGISYKVNNENATITLVKGTYTDRFVLAFVETVLTVDEDVLNNEIAIYADNSVNELVITNKNNHNIRKVELFNLLGQNIHTWKKVTNIENRLKVKSLSSQVYIVKIKTDKGVISKIIIIKKD